MPAMDEAFLKRLMATFRVEADEHVRSITGGLIELEKHPDPQAAAAIIEMVFREAHSLKGAARAVDLTDAESICRSLESLFASVQRGELEVHPALLDTVHRALDALTAIVAAAAGETPVSPAEMAALVQDLADAARRESPPAAPGSGQGPDPEDVEQAPEPPAPAPRADAPAAGTGEPVPPRSASNTVRISIDKLDHLLMQSEELLTLKLMADRNLEKVRELTDVFGRWDRQWAAIDPLFREYSRQEHDVAGRERRRGDARLSRILQFGAATHDDVLLIEAGLAELDRAAEQNLHASRMMVENLVGEVKRLFMLPFSTMLEAFPKVVRDLSRDQGKEVDLAMSGEDIEIDRRILEEMKIALTHLVRNAIDHGIEAPQVRAQGGKSPRGAIRIVVSRGEGNSVDIVVSDDGGGIDLQALRAASSVQDGVSPADDPGPAEKDPLSLVFRSGVSTSATVTDVSGRGLGMAIVREKVEALGGRVAVESRRQEGTIVRMTLPLTLATFRGVLVTTAGRQFVIPAASLERVVRIRREDVRTVAHRDAITMDGATLLLARLSDLLELPEDDGDEGIFTVLILASRERRVGLRVEEVLGEQEVIIKSLRPPLTRVRNVAAATILGSGRVVPVLNVADLVKSAAGGGRAPASAPRPASRVAAAKRSVLVAEDSITSRMLLKNILESAGYEVVTAVDGVDAMTRLKTEKVDAVVSDVDMPRMNGFDLTQKIREDEGLADLPVILVTSLGSREDRERGIDAGANAYIVKSSFDQSDLLETLSRHI